MRISIGILAWNEEAIIQTSLRSLLEQSLFSKLTSGDEPGDQPSFDHIEIVVAPNGCTDATARLASAVLADASSRIPAERFSWKVDEIVEPGKANAWNQYIHRLSDPHADYIILMDADIKIIRGDTLYNMVMLLEQNPDVLVSTDLPVKHVALKPRKGFFDRISLGISQMTQAAPGQLTGQLYCARASILRHIHMPPGLLVEDGFLKEMICTEMLTQPLDNRRIARAAEASHVFEAYTRIRDIFDNQRRQHVSHTVYIFLRDYLEKRTVGSDAGRVIAENNARDPHWFHNLISARVRASKGFLTYPGAFTARFRRLRNLPLLQRFQRLPIAIVAFFMDVIVLTAASRWLRSGRITGIWKHKASTKLAKLALEPEQSQESAINPEHPQNGLPQRHRACVGTFSK